MTLKKLINAGKNGNSKSKATVKSLAASVLTQQPNVPKGSSSKVTKEAVRRNAENHREAMIRLANR